MINSNFYGTTYSGVYSKQKNANDYVNLPKNGPAFQFRSIDASIQYIHIKHFSANPQQMQLSQEFHDQIKDSLTAPHLILDLRNNDGGANKVSKKFIQLLKSYTKKGKLYVLINNRTISQGEIATLQLQELPNVTVIGQTTMGMITYGSNYGARERLPSQKYEVYITDMRGAGDFLAWESVGIKPDVELSETTDWLEQVLALIKNKK